jgi:hypothetical protein
MAKYFERAMRRNPNIELKTCGPYTGTFIPWLGGLNLPQKYALPPDLPLPFPPNVGRVEYDFVRAQLGDWKPDLVLAIDAGINWNLKPKDGVVATVATDPHVLDYTHQRNISDKFFNMQLCYSEKNDIYLPYAYDPTVHFPEETASLVHDDEGKSHWVSSKDIDAILIGMPYENRVAWRDELRKHGVLLHLENGPIFDEYRALANRARIGCTWSSMNDLIARFFETPAFGLPMVANRVPDAHLFLEEGEDYLGFSTLQEAVEKVLWLRDNPERAEKIAESGYQSIQVHTYDSRINQILEECGLWKSDTTDAT